MDRTCKAHGRIETIGERVWRISLVTLLLMGLRSPTLLYRHAAGGLAFSWQASKTMDSRYLVLLRP